MKKFMYKLAILIAPFAFAMCSENGNIPVESNWELEYIWSNGSEMAPPEEHNATIAFLKDSQMAGDTGCNRFFGTFTASDNSPSRTRTHTEDCLLLYQTGHNQQILPSALHTPQQ